MHYRPQMIKDVSSHPIGLETIS